MRGWLVLVVWVAIGCSRGDRDSTRLALPEATGARGLKAHLDAAMAALAARRASARDLVARWKLGPEELGVLTAGYRELTAGYAAAYEQDSAGFAARLDAIARAWPVRIATRAQHADDPALSPAQVHLRWALPTGNPGAVAFVVGDGSLDREAMIEGRIEVVWVHTGTRWGALLGFARVVDATVAARAGCFDVLDRECVRGRCAIEVYRVYDAALNGTDDDVARACARLRDARRSGPGRGEPGPR